MAEFKIASSVLNSSVTVCRLTGELDVEHFDTVMDELEKLVNSGLLGLILDVSEVTKAACPFFGLFTYAARVLKIRNGKLVVAGPAEAVKRFSDIIGLDEIMEVAENVEQARRLTSSLRAP